MTYTGHHDAIISALKSDLAAANAEIERLKALVAMCGEALDRLAKMDAALALVEDGL